MPDARRDRFDDGVGQNCEEMIERKPTRRSRRLLLGNPEEREIDPFGQDLGGELGWLVPCGGAALGVPSLSVLNRRRHTSYGELQRLRMTRPSCRYVWH
jgi:hypothetical protein